MSGIKRLGSKSKIFMFDVESTSLYGVGFAVGVVVWDKVSRQVVDTFELKSVDKSNEVLYCDFVKEQVLPALGDMPTCETNKELRDAFYEFYMKHRSDADIVSDVNYPVETKFLMDVVKDDESARMWNMPYPLYDISNDIDVSVDRVLSSGLQGLRVHNPLDDARASLMTYLNIDY